MAHFSPMLATSQGCVYRVARGVLCATISASICSQVDDWFSIYSTFFRQMTGFPLAPVCIDWKSSHLTEKRQNDGKPVV